MLYVTRPSVRTPHSAAHLSLSSEQDGKSKNNVEEETIRQNKRKRDDNQLHFLASKLLFQGKKHQTEILNVLSTDENWLNSENLRF